MNIVPASNFDLAAIRRALTASFGDDIAAPFEIERLLEVLEGIAVAAARAARTAENRPASMDDGALAEPLVRRLAYACEIIFDSARLPVVLDFLADNLGPGGLLRVDRSSPPG